MQLRGACTLREEYRMVMVLEGVVLGGRRWIDQLPHCTDCGRLVRSWEWQLGKEKLKTIKRTIIELSDNTKRPVLEED